VVSDDVGQLVVEACLERCSGLDVIVFLQGKDIHVVVEDVILREAFFRVIDDIVTDFDNVVIVVNMSADKIIQI
jgi:acyl-CoA reductase-like NAD-dependent aldehyde dehydrogenase